MTTPAQDQAPTLPSPDFERAADMLTAYAELVKITGRYAEEHYIPEIEFIVGELRAAILADRASQAALVAEPDWYLRTMAADLLHLLSFADIKTPSEGDSEQAQQTMARIREHLRAAPVAQPASGEVQAGFIQFEGVDDTTEVMNAKALLRGLGFTVSPGPARVDGAKLLAKSIARHAVAWSEAQAATPTEPLVEQAPQEIPGLGRMSDDDGGFITLQFIDEAAAQAFMMSHGPSVEVDSMPPMRAEQAPQVEASEREDALSHLQHALKLADRMGGGEIAHSVQCAIRALATPSAPALAEPRERDRLAELVSIYRPASDKVIADKARMPGLVAAHLTISAEDMRVMLDAIAAIHQVAGEPRATLTDQHIRDAFMTTNTRSYDATYGAFRDGVRFAEKYLTAVARRAGREGAES